MEPFEGEIVSSSPHLIGEEHHVDSDLIHSPHTSDLTHHTTDAPAIGQSQQAGRPSAEADEEGLDGLLGEGTRDWDED